MDDIGKFSPGALFVDNGASIARLVDVFTVQFLSGVFFIELVSS